MNNSDSFLDFTRCQRADGSHYGTAGKCQKGREVDALQKVKKAFDASGPWAKLKQKIESKPELGRGLHGKVHDMGDGVVAKIGRITPNELKAMEDLKHVEGVPRLLDYAQKNPKAWFSKEAGIMGMTKAPGKPLAGLWNKVTMLDNPSEDDAKKLSNVVDSTLRVLKQVHAKGYTHGDLHINNIFYDSSGRGGVKATLIDFGRASRNNPTEQLKEIMKFNYEVERYASGPVLRKLRSNIATLNSEGAQLRPYGKRGKPATENLIKQIWDDI